MSCVTRKIYNVPSGIRGEMVRMTESKGTAETVYKDKCCESSVLKEGSDLVMDLDLKLTDALRRNTNRNQKMDVNSGLHRRDIGVRGRGARINGDLLIKLTSTFPQRK